ncbi:MAG: hypothetical protein N2Z75_10820, partial [Meiothermus sp.]|nr:hypothetical protein [Meiothermus sp.]
QDEINRWDDAQRARGHEMVRVVDVETTLERLLEAHNCTLSVTREWHVGWAAAGDCKVTGIARFVAYGPTRHEAMKQLFAKVRGTL